MAIFHLSAKIVTRASGRTALGAAAYRSGETLTQDGLGGLVHDYSRKGGVAYADILAPPDAPTWARNRSELWNEVDRFERRKDAQLAREVEVALPVELSKAEQLELIKNFAQTQFVNRGMVADVAIHHDNPQNPHAHILLTLRDIAPDGFKSKRRDWNDKKLLRSWREGWAAQANEALAMAGHEARIDHRSFAAQGLRLEPGRKLGVGQERQAAQRLPRFLAERVIQQREIARTNGDKIIADPSIALGAITYHRATFAERDVATFLSTRTADADQFQLAMRSVLQSREIVALNVREHGEGRYSTREMLGVERQLFTRAEAMSQSPGHRVSKARGDAALQSVALSQEQQRAFTHVLDATDLKAVVGVAGSGKSTLLAAAREAWESVGYHVNGATLSGIAAENLQRASGITSRTLASYEHAWTKDQERLTAKDVLVIDEAGMVGTRQLARILEAAESARAKVVLLGDTEQLQAIEAGAPFRGILATVGGAQLDDVRRQKSIWQRDATRQLATGNTARALGAYEANRHIHAHDTREDARAALLSAWSKVAASSGTKLMLAHTRADVLELNQAARDLRKAQGELRDGVPFETERGIREIATGDHIYFLRNEKNLGVKNGTLATVEKIRDKTLTVRLANEIGSTIEVDTSFYRHFDHGYAATIHKGQGVTVDRSFVLATPNFDRHLTYVALSRHRESAEVHFAREDFADRSDLTTALSRARPQELATDFVEANTPANERPVVERFRKRIATAFVKARNRESQGQDRDLAVHAENDSRKGLETRKQQRHLERAHEAAISEKSRRRTQELDLTR